jgi:hypothetical protein
MFHVGLASRFAILTHGSADFQERAQARRVGSGERRHRATDGEHLMDPFAAVGHRGVAFAQEPQALRQANFAVSKAFANRSHDLGAQVRVLAYERRGGRGFGRSTLGAAAHHRSHTVGKRGAAPDHHQLTSFHGGHPTPKGDFDRNTCKTDNLPQKQ